MVFKSDDGKKGVKADTSNAFVQSLPGYVKPTNAQDRLIDAEIHQVFSNI